MLTEPRTRTMTVKTLVPFLLLTFVLGWGTAALLILFYDQLSAIFGENTMMNPVFILAVYSPSIAGLLLVLWYYGLKGLGNFLRRLTLWRMSTAWWLYLILGIPVIVYAGAALNGTISEPFPFSPWYQVLPALALGLILGPMEEFGWRGVALPLLQRKFNPFWAGLILGVIWVVWHIPAFFMSGVPYTSWSFAPYLGGVVAISVILTPMFNNARGSILIAALYHFQMMNPIFPDAQPWDNLLFIAAAVIVVWLNRRTMFQRGSGVTDVLMPEQGAEYHSSGSLRTDPV